MRKTAILLVSALALLARTAAADEATRRKIARYFEGWYAYVPGSRVVATERRDIVLPGLESYFVERHSESKTHRESNVVFYDRERDELFVGDVLHDAGRAAAHRAFDPDRDLPPLQASLREAFGVPVAITVEAGAHGPLKPIRVALTEEPGAIAIRRGFVSEDGATALLGEFQPASESATAFRQRLLKERPGIRSSSGDFWVTEFLDFECPRCRRRTPEVRKTVESSGGRVEVRLLPLVQQHPGAFAVAETAAALAEVDPALYHRFEEAIFARSEITADAARQLAFDVAESAGARGRFEAALSQGKGRDRVLRDVELAMRLGVAGTPSFLARGVLIPGERWLIEDYLLQARQTLRPAGRPR